jgi:hypothetical protein
MITWMQEVSKSDEVQSQKSLTDYREPPMKLTFDVGNGFEINITVVPPDLEDDEGYVGAVLFFNGTKTEVLEPRESLLGRYRFREPEEDGGIHLILS